MTFNILKNETQQNHLNKDGFTIFNLLNLSECKELLNWKNEKNITDTNTYSKKDQTYSIEKYQENHNYISSKISEKLNQFLKDYKIVFSRFLLKKCAEDAFIPAHQDRQFTDLEDDNCPSYIIWMPLVDVNLNNGTIGFLKGSNLSYHAPPPPFPDPRAKRFNDESIFDMFPYLSFIPLKAGEAVIFNVRTYHGSLPNFSNQERPAIRIDVCNKNAPLFCYFLNNKSDGESMEKYRVDDLFYTRYPNEKLLEIYDNDEPFPDGNFIKSEPYFLLNKTINQYITEHSFLYNEKVEYDSRVSIMVEKRRYVTAFEACIRKMLKPFQDIKTEN
jgi:hypothetical protein